MGVFTATFPAHKGAMSRTLRLLPSVPQLLTKRYYEMLDTAHPLGIGWNQVESVRGWLRASGLIKQVEGSRTGEWELTDLGTLVAEYDRNLSKAATWWLIHIQLATNPDATVYHTLFFQVAHRPFTRAEARGALAARVAKDISSASVDSDLQGILASFEPGRTKLAGLGILLKEGDLWRRGMPEDLSLAMLAYALCVVHERRDQTAPSMSLQSLMGGAGGLEGLFGLELEAIRAPLRLLNDALAPYGYSFVETAGLDSVTFGASAAIPILRRGYEGQMCDVAVA